VSPGISQPIRESQTRASGSITIKRQSIESSNQLNSQSINSSNQLNSQSPVNQSPINQNRQRANQPTSSHQHPINQSNRPISRLYLHPLVVLKLVPATAVWRIGAEARVGVDKARKRTAPLTHPRRNSAELRAKQTRKKKTSSPHAEKIKNVNSQ
jgi:hypothetical protein